MPGMTMPGMTMPQGMTMPGMTMMMSQPGVAGPPPTAPPPVAAAWTGVLTLARNMGKRLPVRAALLHGKVQDVEVALRSAAGNQSLLDITHRVPFDEVSKRIATGSILQLTPNSMMEQASFDEYCKYFKSKQRAGVVRLDGVLALYLLPPSLEDVPSLKDSLYALGSDIPRAGCLIGVIGQGTAAVTGAPTKSAPSAKVAPASEAQKPEVAAPAVTEPEAPAMAEAVSTGPGAEGAEDDAQGENVGMSSNELMDLFSNPDLIKLLSDQAENDKAA
mmetsp:Transcript_79452/g.143382  ORF Transcript_79452/g.143382 Transcript_79452/m.143382 type:complete len:275 (-) Transcript_79452:106-930(-)